jgi:hypothetical protein
MAKKPDKDSINTLKNLIDKLNVLSQLESEQNPFKGNPTIAQMLTEGNAIIAKEAEKAKEEEKKLVLPSPYAEARRLILKSLPGWRYKEIMTMEASKDLNNRSYDEFVAMVAKKGDELSG